MKERSVSLAIPCYNVEKYIEEVMQGVLSQTQTPLEVLLIDDCSTDNTKEILNKYRSDNVRVISNPFNLGLSSVRNIAISNARGDFIAFLDGDVVPEKDWLENVMENFKSNKIAGVGGRLLEKYVEEKSDFWRMNHMSQDPGVNKRNASFIFGSNCVFRKSDLLSIGLYDTSNRTNGEDVLICSKLTKIKKTLLFEPQAICYHLRKDNLISVIRTRWGWANGKSNIKSPEVYSIMCFLFKVIVGFGWGIKCLKADISRKNWKIISIDLFLPFYWSYYTLLKYIEFKSKEIKSIGQSINNF